MTSLKSNRNPFGSTSSTTADGEAKLPFELAATKIEQIKTGILPSKLEALEQHKKNIQVAWKTQDHAQARKEMLKASLLAGQIKRELVNLDNLKQRLHETHHRAFDTMVNGTVKKASVTLDGFYELERKQRCMVTETEHEEVEEEPIPQLQVAEHLSELEEAEAYARAVENIQRDCEDIHCAYTTLSKIVAESAEVVDKVEDNIVITEEHVKKSERLLAYCARKNLVFTPLLGALVGACVGGPVGLVVGAKVAFAAALGGGVLGFSGARALKKNKLKEIDAIDASVHENQS